MNDGDKAWLGLLVYVAGYDTYATLKNKPTLSMSFWAAIGSPVRRWPTIALWVYLTAHLFHLIPERFDPLRQLFREVNDVRAAQRLGIGPQRK